MFDCYGISGKLPRYLRLQPESPAGSRVPDSLYDLAALIHALLASRFGDEFHDYQRSVPDHIPFVK